MMSEMPTKLILTLLFLQRIPRTLSVWTHYIFPHALVELVIFVRRFFHMGLMHQN